MASSSQHRCVFVGNIPYDATEEQLVQICEEVGPVVSFRLVVDRETGKPKGYGFCEYKDEETALSARRNLHGYEINGRQLRVDFAENDKDRNREEGRGGPGLISNIDAQKISSGPPLLGNSYIQQPIGLPLAANAASMMAGALGGVQTSNIPIQNPSGFGGDPLTLYLAKMSRNQLYEIMREMKALVSRDKTLALRVLQICPQLSKALFQSQIMLGLVPQHFLQMANNHQPGSVGMKPQISSDGQTISLPHTAQVPALQSTAQIGIYSQPRIQPDYQSLSSSIQPTTLPTVTGILPVQPPLMQQPNQEHSVSASANTSAQQPALVQPPPPQVSRSHVVPSSAMPYLEQVLKDNDARDPTIHPSKFARIENEPQIISSSKYAATNVPGQGPVPGSGFTSQAANIDGQKSEKQIPQFLPEAEAALLQQVMNLTAEELNSLPPEQRQQVVQLQQMLRS